MLTFGHSACKRTPPRMCWSGCSLLVDDLKAAAALLSSVVVEAGCQRLQAIVKHLRTMHVPCMPTLTLADTSARQSDRHESFDHAHRNASGRCSTSASMCCSRAVQRKQRSGDGEGRDCSPPRTAAVL